MDKLSLWNQFKSTFFHSRAGRFTLDISRMKFDAGFISANDAKLRKAFDAMADLEKGAIANPDEKRMVGHYWLRNPGLAPDAKIKSEIETTLSNIKTFAKKIHSGEIAPQRGGTFKHLLVVGIGGSALGPQFVNQALGSPQDPMNVYFFDNTDPDGMSKVISSIPDLAATLCVVISKSGGTKETRNGQLIAKKAWECADLDFSRHFVAVTGEGSELDVTAKNEKWLARFPMWDWVGGRTSELSAVGLLPMALQGFNVDEVLRGAREMDALTRNRDAAQNPAALLSLSWLHAGKGKGLKDMVVLPYKDRLELFSRYLQQLLMESLGKEKDLSGALVHQGIAVYGNKGSTDQHAYVQQLRDGVNNFFVVFIEVLRDATSKSKGPRTPQGFDAVGFEVEEKVTSGDYLSGFFQGTRSALFESDRESVSITIDEVTEHSVGQLIALFERAVGFYASFVNINAYHQPGVEAGKKAAASVLALQTKVVDYVAKSSEPSTAEEIAAALNEKENTETIFKILRHLGANGRLKINPGANLIADKYGK